MLFVRFAVFKWEGITAGVVGAGGLCSATHAAIYFCLWILCKLSDLLSFLKTSFCSSCWLQILIPWTHIIGRIWCDELPYSSFFLITAGSCLLVASWFICSQITRTTIWKNVIYVLLFFTVSVFYSETVLVIMTGSEYLHKRSSPRGSLRPVTSFAKSWSCCCCCCFSSATIFKEF